MENKLKVGPKDFFIQLGILVTLYTAVTSLLALVFDIINARFPDALNSYYSYDAFSTGMRFEIATLVIFFPLFLVFARIAQRDFEKAPEKLMLWTRRWASYLNLFASIGTITVTLVMLLNDFLGGELTARFGLKALATVVVAAIVLLYYLSDIRKAGAFPKKCRLWYLGSGTVLVLLAVLGAFATMGSPWTQRLIRFDSQRTGDLQSIQYQIVNYWQSHGTLPATLGTLQDPISGFKVPMDPEGKAYTYEATGKLSFSLCAEFNFDSAAQGPLDGNGLRAIPIPTAPYPSISDIWQHSAGKQCFVRTIDPKAYPVAPTAKAI